MSHIVSRILASGCAALLVFVSAVGARAEAVVVEKYENLLHSTVGEPVTESYSPFFTAHTDGVTPFDPADGWAPLDVTIAGDTTTATSTTPHKSFSILGDSTAAGNWTDGNGIPAGITLTFDAQFTITPISTLPEDTGVTLMLTVPGFLDPPNPNTRHSGRGIGVTSVPGGADDINNGRGLAFSAITVSNVVFSGSLADPGYTFTPGGVSGMGAQLFESGIFQETSQGMTLTHDTGTIGFGQALGSGTTAAFGELKMNLNFGPFQDPPGDSSAFPRQPGPFSISTTQGSAATFRGISLGYDVTYDISAATTEDADFDGDGDIDGADFLTWQRGVGTAGTQAQGNADGQGLIDGADLAIWEAQFGTATAASAPVPEPASALLALAAAVGAAAIRHGRRVG
jgi:hypothetical protein